MALLLSLSLLCGCVSVVTSSCHVTSYTECQGVPFVPGYNLVGEGFDVVHLKATGSAVIDVKTFMSGGEQGNCTLCLNKLLNQTQKLPASVKDWKIQVRCRRSLSSKVLSSTQSVLRETSNSLSASWKVGLGLPAVAHVSLGGSHSSSSSFAQSHSKSNKVSFVSHKVGCSYYRFRVHSYPPLTKEFQDSLHRLTPSSKDNSDFEHFLSLYGTHYLRQVTLGGQMRSLTAVQTCEASLNRLSTRTINNCLSAEAEAVIKGVKVSAAASFCKKQAKKLQHGHSFSGTFSDRSVEVLGGDSSVGGVLFNPHGAAAFQKWLHSIRSLPGLVQYKLTPLFRLVRNPRLRSRLRKEIKSYIMKNAVSLKCRRPCQAGVQAQDCSCSCHGHSLVNADCCPQEFGVAQLKVVVVRGEGLYGDIFSKTDGYVKVFYKNQGATSGVIWNNDFPIWNFVVRIGSAKLISRT
uniref:MACPF domain-containing protein n=1 Tax=Periophthalmus magnuspinnatus TaxID=409849 RepID=A0A3B4AU44_9GOBI